MYDEYSKIQTPNGGFFIVKNNFDYKLSYNKWVKYIKKYLPIHPFLIDEISIGYIVYTSKLDTYNVDRNIYNTIPNLVTTETKLVHFYRYYKPWKIEIIQHLYNTWIKNYFKCVEISGIQSNEVIIYKNINQIILKNICVERWTELLNKFCYSKDLQLKPDFTQYYIRVSRH